MTKFFSCIQNYKLNLNEVNFFFIIIIFCIYSVETLTPYKIFYFEKFNRIFSICDKHISIYDPSTLGQFDSYTFIGEQLITSSEESNIIDACSFYDEEFKQIFIIVKNYIYFYSSNTYLGNSKIEDIFENQPNLIPYKCLSENTEQFCYFFIAIITTDKNLKVYKYKYNIDNKELVLVNSKLFQLMNSSGKNSKSSCDNVSCQIMVYSSNKVLTCFYENDNFQLGTINLNVETLEQYESLQSKFIKNSGAKYIKSVLFNNDEKAFICYINNINNTACIIYDIKTKQWLFEYKYIEECIYSIYLFNLDYYSNEEKYILSCFNSNNKIEYAIFNNKFDIYNSTNNSDYCLTTLELEYCSGSSTSALIHDTTSIFYLERICGIGNNEMINKYQVSLTCNKNYDKERIIMEDNEEPIHNNDNNDNNNNIEPIDKFRKKEIVTIKSEITIEKVANNLDKLIKEVDINKIYEIKGNDYNIRISPTNFRDFKNNSTYINFFECEKILREKYKLSFSNELILVMLEIDKNNEKSLTNQVEYAIYNDKKERLDLSQCKNSTIKINYGITNTSIIDTKKLMYYSEIGVDILNSQDEFFNDICYSYSERSTDVILNDRILDIYQNYSLCDSNCHYEMTDLESMLITCNCDIKTSVKAEREPPSFDSIVLNIASNSSIGVIQCYKLIFNFRNKLNNLGFWIFSVIILIHTVLVIHYFLYGINPIKKYIVSEMSKYNYLNNFNNPNKKVKFDIYRYSNKSPSTIMKIKRRKNKFHTINVMGKTKEIENKRNIMKGKYLKTSTKKVTVTINDKSKDSNLITSYNKFHSNDKCISYTMPNKDYDNKDKIINKNILYEYFLIQVSANNSLNNEPPKSNLYLSNYDYDEALQYDKRSFWRIYLICILTKENILNLFFIKSPLELKSLRLSQFLFSYSCDLAFNTLFYFNSNISDRYKYEGNNLFWFSLLNNIVICIVSTSISFSLCAILQFLTNSKESVEDLFRDEEKKMRKNSKYKVDKSTKKKILMDIYEINKILKLKILIFIILETLFLLFFYYLVTAFCEVYQKTQISWISDSFMSFLISFPIEFAVAFLNAVLYKISIIKRSKLLYKLAMGLINLS